MLYTFYNFIYRRFFKRKEEEEVKDNYNIKIDV